MQKLCLQINIMALYGFLYPVIICMAYLKSFLLKTVSTLYLPLVINM